MLQIAFKTIFVGLVLLIVHSASANNVQVVYSPKFVDHYKQANAMKEVAEKMAANVHKDLGIVFKECGAVNAYYSSHDKTVTICYEYLYDAEEYILKKFKGESVSNLSNMVTGTVGGVLLHELGHALVDLYDFPILGGEEDAVDRYATVMLLNITEANPSMGILYLLGDMDYQWGKRIKTGIMDRLFSKDRNYYHDEHPLNEQRVFNKVCLAYGYNQNIYAGLAKRFNLPNSRAVKCKFEYQAAKNAVMVLMKKISNNEIQSKGIPVPTSAPVGPTWFGQLGVLIGDMQENQAKTLGLFGRSGAFVQEVVSASHASRSELRAKDVILKLNGATINSASDIPRMLSEIPLNTNLALSVWRSGKHHEIQVVSSTAGQTNNSAPNIPDTPISPSAKFGLDVMPLPVDQRKLLQIESGVFVSKSTGSAAKAGIVEGDLIVAVRTFPVNSQEDLDKEISNLNSKSVTFLVKNGNGIKYISVVLD